MATSVGRGFSAAQKLTSRRLYSTTLVKRTDSKSVAVTKDKAKEVVQEVAKAKAPEVPKPTVVKKSGGSSLGQRLVAFGIGAGVGGAAGYYQLHEDIWKSAQQMEDAVTALRADAIDASEALEVRVAKLEKELFKLKQG